MSETLAAVRAETTKLRGIRGTRISLLLFAAVSVLIAALDGWSAKNALESDNPSLRSDFTPEQAGLDGILYGQLALIVFGVLVVTSEYTSGMIRVSLLAVPGADGSTRRRRSSPPWRRWPSPSPSPSSATWSRRRPSGPTVPRSARAVSRAPWPGRSSI